VLDWIVERKAAEDLVSSIRDGRYSRQKYRMAQCGLRLPMYLVEGSLNDLDSGAQSAKTAAVETEIVAGALPSLLLAPRLRESRLLRR